VEAKPVDISGRPADIDDTGAGLVVAVQPARLVLLYEVELVHAAAVDLMTGYSLEQAVSLNTFSTQNFM